MLSNKLLKAISTYKQAGLSADIGNALSNMDPTLRNSFLGAGAGGIAGAGLGIFNGLAGPSRPRIDNAMAASLLSRGISRRIVDRLSRGRSIDDADKTSLRDSGIDLEEIAPLPGYLSNLLGNSAAGGLGGLALGALAGGGLTEAARLATPHFVFRPPESAPDWLADPIVSAGKAIYNSAPRADQWDVVRKGAPYIDAPLNIYKKLFQKKSEPSPIGRYMDMKDEDKKEEKKAGMDISLPATASIAGLLGAGYGAGKAPGGDMLEEGFRGGIKGTATGLGAYAGDALVRALSDAGGLDNAALRFLAQVSGIGAGALGGNLLSELGLRHFMGKSKDRRYDLSDEEIRALEKSSALSPLLTTLGGAGIGAAVGGIGDWLMTDPDDPDDSLLDGILGGAAVGGGLGYMGNAYANRLVNKFVPNRDALPGDIPTSTRDNAVSLSEVLPEGYQEEAQRLAQEYRDAGEYLSEDDFRQVISDKALNRKVDVDSLGWPELLDVFSEENTNRFTNPTSVYHSGGFSSPDGNTVVRGGPDRISRLKPELAAPLGKDGLPHALTLASQRHTLSDLQPSPLSPEHKDVLALLKDVGGSLDPDRSARILTDKFREEAFLADIKRDYFSRTGKHITSPEEARVALAPYDSELSSIMKGVLSNTLPRKEPIQPRYNSEEVSKARESWIKKLIKKMPGLVQNNIAGRGKYAEEGNNQ